MGFQKWIMKNGVGSVGSIARFWTTEYIKSHAPTLTLEERLWANASLLLSFQTGLNVAGLKPIKSHPYYTAQICEDIPGLIIMCIVMENIQHIKALHSNDKALKTVIEIVQEIYTEGTGDKTTLTGNYETKLIKQLLDIRYKRAISDEHLNKLRITLHKPIDDLYFIFQVAISRLLSKKNEQYHMGAYYEGIMLLIAGSRYILRTYTFITTDILKNLYWELYLDFNKELDNTFKKSEYLDFLSNRLNLYEKLLTILHFEKSSYQSEQDTAAGIVTNLLFETPLANNPKKSIDLEKLSVWYPEIPIMLNEIKEFIQIRFDITLDNENHTYYDDYKASNFESRCSSCGYLQNYMDMHRVTLLDDEDGSVFRSYYCEDCIKTPEGYIARYSELYNVNE